MIPNLAISSFVFWTFENRIDTFSAVYTTWIIYGQFKKFLNKIGLFVPLSCKSLGIGKFSSLVREPHRRKELYSVLQAQFYLCLFDGKSVLKNRSCNIDDFYRLKNDITCF